MHPFDFNPKPKRFFSISFILDFISMTRKAERMIPKERETGGFPILFQRFMLEHREMLFWSGKRGKSCPQLLLPWKG